MQQGRIGVNTPAKQNLVHDLIDFLQNDPKAFNEVDGGSKGYLTLSEFVKLVRQFSDAQSIVILDLFKELTATYERVSLKAITGSDVRNTGSQAPSKPKDTTPQVVRSPATILQKIADNLQRQGRTCKDVFARFDEDGDNLYTESELKNFLDVFLGPISGPELEQLLTFLNKYRIQPFKISSYQLIQVLSVYAPPQQTPPPPPPSQPQQSVQPVEQVQPPQPIMTPEAEKAFQQINIKPRASILVPGTRPQSLNFQSNLPGDLLDILTNRLPGEPPLQADANIAGIQEFITQLQNLVKSNDVYTDFKFKADQKILAVDEDTNSRHNYPFLRPKDIWKNDDYDVFEVRSDNERQDIGAIIDPDDIQQGALGDCYFLSTLSSFSNQYPEAIMNLFITRKKNPNGFYCVQLCLEGVWTAITIDDLFPTNNGKPAYTRSDAKEIWVMILEKAWAKAYGDYGNIEAGLAKEVMRALTGCPCVSLRTDDPNFDGQVEAYSKLNYVMTSGSQSGMTKQQEDQLGIGFSDRQGLVTGHAYSFLRVLNVKHPARGDVKLVQLRNPWGQKEWTYQLFAINSGDWSDSSSLWTPQLRQFAGLSEKNDGDFYMDIKEFKKYYSGVDIGMYRPNFKYVAQQVKANQKKALYYQFDVKTTGEYFIAGVQTSERHFREQYENYQYSSLRVVLAKSIGDGKYELVGTKTAADREVWVGGTLSEGTYVLYCKASWKYWPDHELVVSSYGREEVALKPIPKVADLIQQILIQRSQQAPPQQVQTKYSGADGKIEIISEYKLDNGFGYVVFRNTSKSSQLEFQILYDQMGGLKLRKPFRGNTIKVSVAPGQTICAALTISPEGFSLRTRTGGSLKSV